MTDGQHTWFDVPTFNWIHVLWSIFQFVERWMSIDYNEFTINWKLNWFRCKWEFIFCASIAQISELQYFLHAGKPRVLIFLHRVKPLMIIWLWVMITDRFKRSSFLTHCGNVDCHYPGFLLVLASFTLSMSCIYNNPLSLSSRKCPPKQFHNYGNISLNIFNNIIWAPNKTNFLDEL